MSEHSGSSGDTMAQIVSPRIIEGLGDMGVSAIVSQLKELGLSDSKDEDSSGLDPMYTSGMHSYGDDHSSDTTIDNVERYGRIPTMRTIHTDTSLASTRKRMQWLRLKGQREKPTSGTGRSFTKDQMYVG